MQITPHLHFEGQCREAFQFYQKILGGEISTMLSYRESPMSDHYDSEWQEKIIHASLKLDHFELAGVDIMPQEYKVPQGFNVILSITDVDEGKQIFEKLAVGGEIKMPFEKTFWSDGFGVLIDKFGIPWEINAM